MKFFSASNKASLPLSFWPRGKVVTALKYRFQKLDDLGEEEGLRLYGATEGEVRFVIALILVEGDVHKVSEVGFLARFSGFALSNQQLDAVNRNLHISVATFHNDGDLYLIGGVAAAGKFSEGTFSLVLEAWKRDMLVVLHGVSSVSFLDAFPMGRSDVARRFALNQATDEPAAYFKSLAAKERNNLCPECLGRGRRGFSARQCQSCGGIGFSAHQRG